MKLGKYQVMIRCLNCGFPNTLKIKKGVEVVDYFKNNQSAVLICDTCKCDYPLKSIKEYYTKWLK